MIESEIIQWAVNNGFAVAVTIYLLFERKSVTEKMTASIDRNTDAITMLSGAVSSCPKK